MLFLCLTSEGQTYASTFTEASGLVPKTAPSTTQNHLPSFFDNSLFSYAALVSNSQIPETILRWELKIEILVILCTGESCLFLLTSPSSINPNF